jgi:outer membrane protein assembly factor BamB
VDVVSMKKAIFFFTLLLIATLPVMGGVRSSFGGSANVSGWPMFHRDPSHLGYTTSLAPEIESLRWNYKADGYVFSSPAVADGIVFVGSSDTRVYALDELTGGQVWNYTTAGAVESSPALVDGIVFVGSNDGNVYALNEVTGGKAWSFQTGNSLFYSSPAVVDGLVFIGSSDGNVYALRESTGEKIWSENIKFGGLSSPAIADGMVFIGNAQAIYALNEQTGTDVWSYDTGQGMGATSPAVANGMVFTSDTGGVFALNETSGKRIWSFGTSTYMFSSPAVADGIVFIGAYPSGFYALNETTGALIWTTWGTTYIGCDFSSPAVAKGIVYVGSFDNNIYALNESTGAVIWSRYIGYAGAPYVQSSPAIADNMMFMAGGANIYCFGQSVNLKPVLEVINPSNNTIVSSSDVTLHWNCRSIISVGYFSVRLDNDQWIDTGDNSTYTFKDLPNGNHTVYIQAFDRGGLNSTVLVDFNVSALKFTPEIAAIIGAVSAIIVVLTYVVVKKSRVTKKE